MSHLAIFVLGPPRFEIDGELLELDRNKAIALLVYLTLQPGEHSRQSLAALFFPEAEQEKAYAYLRRTLWSLNQALGPGWIAAERETLAVDQQADIWIDAVQFQQLLSGCEIHAPNPLASCPGCIRLAQQAVDLYQGDFLAGFSLRDAPEFDEWQFFQSERLRTVLSLGLERLVTGYQANADLPEAIATAQRWVAFDRLNEKAQRSLIRSYMLAGRRSEALRQYQECERVLQQELGVAPEEETQALLTQVRRGESLEPQRASLPADKPVSVAPSGPVQLPIQATHFIGRDRELGEINRLLGDPDCRLITLLGPGGIGKTRLAIEAARRSGQQGDFLQGIYFVPLAALSSPEFLVPSIAEVLHFSFRVEEPPEPQLIHYLRAKNLLLILDNFEHLIAGADLLSEVLSNAPQVKILVTSRERLNLVEEWVMEVGGMSFPENETTSGLEAFSAVQLFLQQARRARLDFNLSEAEKPAVVRICRLLEGLPLGIELAAAWVRLFTCQQIAREIEDNLDFLQTSLRGVPERHQSLRAVFQHSWNLLTEVEQEAYCRLSVFRADFSLDAAQYVSKAGLPVISALVDKSLLGRAKWTPPAEEALGASLEARYIMHERLKQYAAEKLDSHAEEFKRTRQRHCEFFANQLSRLSESLRSEKQIAALQLIEHELEDIRQAWFWTLEPTRVAQLAGLAESLARFYDIRSRFREGRDLFHPAVEFLRQLRQERVTAKQSTTDLDGLFGFVLCMDATFTNASGNPQLAYALLQESLTIMRSLEDQQESALAERALLNLLLGYGTALGEVNQPEIEALYQQNLEIFTHSGNRWGTAMSHLAFGDIAQYPLKDYERARQLRQESLRLFEAVGDRWGMALAYNSLATMAYGSGDYSEAQRLSLRSLTLYRQIGDNWRIVGSLLNLGQAATALGDYDRARSYYQESLHLVDDTGNPMVIGTNLACLGYVDYLSGEYEQAEAHYRQSLDIARNYGDLHGVGMAYTNLGDLAEIRGDFSEARRLYLRGQAQLAELNEPWGLAVCTKKLAHLALRQGDLGQAKVDYRQALELSAGVDRLPEILEDFIGIAELLATSGQPEEAARILSFCTAHPAIARQAQAHAQTLLADMQVEIPEQAYSQAVQQGQQSELHLLVSQLMAALAPGA